MSNEQQGSVYLSCRAYLNNSRDALHESDAVFLDAVVVPSVAIANSSPLTCCLFYMKSCPDEDIAPGMYDIVSKVHNLSFHISISLTTTNRFQRALTPNCVFPPILELAPMLSLDLFSLYVFQFHQKKEP